MNATSNGWTFWSVSTSIPIRWPTSVVTSSSSSSSQRESVTSACSTASPRRARPRRPRGPPRPSARTRPARGARARGARRSGCRGAGRPRAAPCGRRRRARRGPCGTPRASFRALAAERRELLGQRGEHRVEAAHRLLEDPDLLLVEVGEERLLPLLDDEVDLDGPVLAEPVEPADALLEHERRLRQVGADEVAARTGSSAPRRRTRRRGGPSAPPDRGSAPRAGRAPRCEGASS